jgi:arylsulfatase A-like enzyme/Tfp pilus assembly protein PilF
MQVSRQVLFLLILAQCAGAAATSRATPRRSSGPVRPNIIIITLDTTRADRMGFLGSTRGLTPNLDALAKQSVVFTRAYAQVPLTTPSHATIFTGTYPQYNHLDYMGEPLGKDLPYLPAILKAQGYRTAAFVGSFIIDPNNVVATGFGRGWDTYDAHFHNRARGEDRYKSVERRADVVVDHALAWLKAHPKGPFLMWVHCYDPHAPYDPPPPFKARYAKDPYDGEIAYTDSAMGKLFAGLKAKGLYDRAVIAVMADHGEALGQHGEEHHGIFLYDETIHVPLLFKLSGERFADKKMSGRVRLVDVTPTILQIVGVPVPPVMQGESLLGVMKLQPGEPPPPGVDADRSVFSISDYGQRAFGWSWLRSLRSGKYLYVDAPHRELYDQTVDPGALHNLASTSKAVADTLQAQSDEFVQRTKSAATAEAGLTSQQIESLRALGYVGTNSVNNEEGAERGPDPKGKTAVATLFEQALNAMLDHDFDSAVPKLQEVLKLEPNTALAYVELGRAYVNTKQYDKALPPLRTAVEKLPKDALARFEYGRALVESGNWDEALPQLEVVLAQDPDSPDLHFNLALVYEHLQRIPEAMTQFQATLKLKPDHFRANLLLGRLYGMQGNGAAALPLLLQAAKLDPKSLEAHMFLANVYAELGQTANAMRERDLVLRQQRAQNP